ncbi:MAG: ABC transporter permease [bacterium]
MRDHLILFITLCAGALLGLINGLITVKGRIPSFITTLGTMMFWRGVLYVHSRMWPIGIRAYLPPGSSFENILTGTIGGVLPVQVVWFGFFGLVLGILLHFHKFGNWVYATGDNREAARAMGINTDRVKTICFMIVGILCAFVAVLQVVRVSSFSSRAGDGWELKAVAASVVGGTFLMGGVGSMAGIFLGALTISVIENGLVVLRIPYFWTYVVFGLVIIFSVLSSMYIERRKLGHGSASSGGSRERNSVNPE